MYGDVGDCFSFTHLTVDQIIWFDGEEGSWWFVEREAVDDIAGTTVDVARGY